MPRFILDTDTLSLWQRGHPKVTAELIGKAERMYDARQFTMAEIATSCGVTPMTVYRHIRTDAVGGTDRPA